MSFDFGDDAPPMRTIVKRRKFFTKRFFLGLALVLVLGLQIVPALRAVYEIFFVNGT